MIDHEYNFDGNCEYLSVNPKASKDNKNHFKELEKTAFGMC